MAIIEFYSSAFEALAKALSVSIGVLDSAENRDLAKLGVEAERQSLEMRMLESQARVAQELAIANRIENAEEVEIEEFYDTAGKGSVGVSKDADALTLGASGGGRKIVRRVYRFKRSVTAPGRIGDDRNK